VIEQLGRYRLTARIATGGMAEVFLARAEGVEGFQRTVVIKRLLPHLAREPQVVEMFLNEARLTGRLDHANIVGVQDLGQAAGHYFIAMEFLDGRALAEVRDAARAQGGLLPVGFVLKTMSEALAGLHHANEARGEDGRPMGIVHRDFNPDNIVVTYDGRVKVVDFGIAKVQSALSSTEPGTLKGKYFYMSPEMVLGNPLDRRADIFAAGVALYELLCDKRPFEGDTPNSILSAIAYGTAVAPRALNPALPAALEQVVMRCLARVPDERYSTALQVKEALDALAPSVGAFGPAEVGQLMELLFPPQDLERRRISELRQIDPSLPDQPRLAVGPEHVTSPQRPGNIARGEKVQVRPPRAPLPVKQIALGVGALGLLGGLTVGGMALWPHLHHPPDAAAQRLEAQEKELRAHPDDAALADRVSEALLQAGRDGEAEEIIDRTLTAHPDDARAHVQKGDLLGKRRFGQKALEEYARALKLAPNDPTALTHQGRLHVARGELSEARTALALALALRPRDKQLALEVADLQGRAGDWPTALSTLNALATRYPADADVKAALGFALLQSGDDRRALTELLAADKARPHTARTETFLGFVFYKQGKTQKAIESYRAAIAHAAAPTDAAAAHAALGQVLLARGDRDAARVELAAAVKADPSLTDAAADLKKLQDR
jgi:serine/threonine protein kinase/Flp pilus assembly protein TadD